MALIAAHLNAVHSGDDSVAIGIYSPSSHTSIPPSPFSPSLISLMVSVDVKHHVHLLTFTLTELRSCVKVEVAVLVLTSLMVSVDVKQY